MSVLLNFRNLQAQDAALNQANYFFDNKSYEDAITEYQRFIFFNPEHDMVGDAYYKLGMAYRNQEQWQKAMEAIRKSIYSTTNDSIKDERKIAIALIQFVTTNYSSAEFELLRVAHFSKYAPIKKKAFFFLGVCNLYTYKWEEARAHFSRYGSNSILDSLLLISGDLNHKSPKTALWLSTFIPGLGQIYCGDWKNGINALVLNSTLGYLFIDSLIDRRFQDTIISFFPFFRRYYSGNRFHAQRIANEYNDRVKRNFAKKIIDYLHDFNN